MTFALRFKSPEISSEFKRALDDAAQNCTSSPVKAACSSSAATVQKEVDTSQSKPAKSVEPSKQSDEALFKPEDFKPLEQLAKEIELSFDGQVNTLFSLVDTKHLTLIG